MNLIYSIVSKLGSPRKKCLHIIFRETDKCWEAKDQASATLKNFGWWGHLGDSVN